MGSAEFRNARMDGLKNRIILNRSRKDYNNLMDFSHSVLRAVTAFLLGMVMLMASSCGTTGGGDLEKVSALLDEGKSRLSQADYLGAKVHFERILDQYDPFHSQAHFGIVMAELLELGDQASEMTYFVAGSGSSGFIPLVDQPGNRQVYEAVRGVLENLESRLLLVSNRLDLIQEDPIFRFSIQSAPIFRGEDTVVELGGEYDPGDVYCIDAVVSLLLGMVGHVLSVDFLADYLGLFDFASRNLSEVLLGGEVDASLLSGLLVFLLKDPDYPEFLGCAGSGRYSLVSAGEWYERALRSFLESLDWIIEREGTTDSHFLYYQDANGDRAYQEEEPIVFPPYRFTPNDTLSLRLVLTPTVREGIRALADSFRFSEIRVSLSRHLLPVIGALVVGSGEALGILPELAEVIWKDITDTLGDRLEFQLGPLFDDSVCLRNLLPAWNSTADRDEVHNEKGEFNLAIFRRTNRFLFEWDGCGYVEAATGFVCPRVDVEDREHFGEASLFIDFPEVVPIPADGITSPFPYFPLPNPSLNQVLWVNMSGLPDGQGGFVPDDTPFHPANLFEINTLIAGYAGFINLWLENMSSGGEGN